MALDLDKIETWAKAEKRGAMRDAMLALVARAREADRLEEENAKQKASYVDENEILVRAEKAFARADTAEAQCARLRTIVEKLWSGLEPFGKEGLTWGKQDGVDYDDAEACGPWTDLSIGQLRAASRLLAETAPDVTADEGRAG